MLGIKPPDVTITSVDEDRNDSVCDSGVGSMISIESLSNFGVECNLPSVKEAPEESERLKSISKIFDKLRIDNVHQSTSSRDEESGFYSMNGSDTATDSVSFCGSGLENSSTQSVPEDNRTSIIVPAVQRIRLFEGDNDGDNKLHISILQGDSTLTNLLISLAPDYTWLNLSNLLRQTPLHLAVLTKQSAIVRRLLCAGAEATAQDRDGNTALHIACREGYEDIVRQLLRPVTYQETRENTYDIPFQRLPQDMNVRNYEGETCLHIAVRHGHTSIVNLLLDVGADINVGDGKSGRTALHIASELNNVDLVKLILYRSDAKVDARNYAGLTPVQLAYGRGHKDSVNVICRHMGVFCEVSLSDSSEADDCSDEEMYSDSD